MDTITVAKQPLKTTEEYFNEFLFVVYMVDPTKDNVRLALDDGSIKMTMKRDKFYSIMETLLNETLLTQAQYILFRIRESLRVYGGIYYFDKVNLDFRQLQEAEEFHKINPQELLKESRKSLIKEKISADFSREVNTQYDEHMKKFDFQGPKKILGDFMTVLRDLGNKKNRKRTL